MCLEICTTSQQTSVSRGPRNKKKYNDFHANLRVVLWCPAVVPTAPMWRWGSLGMCLSELGKFCKAPTLANKILGVGKSNLPLNMITYRFLASQNLPGRFFNFKNREAYQKYLIVHHFGQWGWSLVMMGKCLGLNVYWQQWESKIKFT